MEHVGFVSQYFGTKLHGEATIKNGRKMITVRVSPPRTVIRELFETEQGREVIGDIVRVIKHK